MSKLFPYSASHGLILVVNLHLLIEESAELVVGGLDQRIESVGVFFVALATFQPGS